MSEQEALELLRELNEYLENFKKVEIRRATDA